MLLLPSGSGTGAALGRLKASGTGPCLSQLGPSESRRQTPDARRSSGLSPAFTWGSIGRTSPSIDSMWTAGRKGVEFWDSFNQVVCTTTSSSSSPSPLKMGAGPFYLIPTHYPVGREWVLAWRWSGSRTVRDPLAGTKPWTSARLEPPPTRGWHRGQREQIPEFRPESLFGSTQSPPQRLSGVSSDRFVASDLESCFAGRHAKSHRNSFRRHFPPRGGGG